MSVLKRIFNKNNKEINTDESEFSASKILKIFRLISWNNQYSFVLTKKSDVIRIYIRENQNDWIFQEQPDLETAEKRMLSLVPDSSHRSWEAYRWEAAITSGLLSQAPDPCYGSYLMYGYADINIDEPSDNSLQYISPDSFFSLGRDLEARLNSGWLPKTEKQFELLAHYLNNVPLVAGYFGPFKNILKKLSDLCRSSNQIDSNLLVCIGNAYGRVEAKTSSLRMAFIRNRQDYYGWNLSLLVGMPDFVGNRYPRLKTLQYLSRRGLRLYQHIAKSNPVQLPFFEIAVLKSANEWHNSNLPEENYLSKQMLVTQIIYAGSNLAMRNIDGRTVDLDSRKKRHIYDAPNSIKKYETSNGSFTKTDLTKIFERSINPFNSNSNSAVVQYLFKLLKTNKVEFSWSYGAISGLSQSENPSIQAELLEYLLSNPDKFVALPAEKLLEFLDGENKQIVEAVVSAMENSLSRYFGWNTPEHFHQQTWQQIAISWIEKYLPQKLSENKVRIAVRILVSGWNKLLNSGPTNYLRDSLLLKILQYLNEDIINLLTPKISEGNITREWNDKFGTILAYLGIAPNDIHKKGVLDYNDLSDPRLLTAFGSQLANSIRYSWAENKEIKDFVGAFFESKKPGAVDLIISIWQNASLDEKFVKAISENLSKFDPEGNTFIKLLRLNVAGGDRNLVLKLIKQLSNAKYESFWRRNSTELKKLFIEWNELPDFIWKNLGNLNKEFVEFVGGIKGFDSQLFSFLTPRAINRMSSIQSEFFISLLKANIKQNLDSTLVKALLIAPSAELNEIGAQYVFDKKLIGEFWLVMIESNLPISINVATTYLQNCMKDKDFKDKVLMALDSNNETARKRALEVVAKTRDVETMREIVTALSENRNPDTWKTVYSNIGLIEETSKLHEFTDQVFLSRRKARSAKESIKNTIDQLLSEIEVMVSQRTLIRMSRSSVASDREWALQKIVSGQLIVDDLIIEETWKI